MLSLSVLAAEMPATVAKPALPALMQSKFENVLRQQEYAASSNAIGLQAPNRALGIRTYFGNDGLRIVDRYDDATALFDWRVLALRRGAISAPVRTGRIERDGSRVSLQHEALSQSFDNTADGLRSALRIDETPLGNGPLELQIELGAGRAAPDAASGALRVVAADGSLFDLGRLVASDADGRELALTTRASKPGELHLTIEDREATLPITVKTVVTRNYDFRAQSNQVSAHFATSVAVVGDLNFDTISDFAVGAPDWDGGQTDEGAVFIYYGGTNLVTTFDLVPDQTLEINQGGARLGTSVAAAGDVNRDNLPDVIAGAPGFDNGSLNEGAAFVFSGLDIVFLPGAPPYGQLEGNRGSAAMGSSVAGAGDMNGDGFPDVIVGAPGFQLGTTLGGRAFVFNGGFAATFDITPDATYSASADGAELGASVAGAGDVNGDGRADVLVGAPGGGFVELHRGDGATVLFDSDVLFNGLGTEFGRSVAGVGDVNGDGYSDILMAAPSYSALSVLGGAAFLFYGGPGAFNMTIDATLDVDQLGADFGSSMSGAADINGDGYSDFAVGAPHYGDGDSLEGHAFVYLGRAGAFPSGAAAALQINQANALLGSSIALGDINGDGYADVLTGAPYADFGHSDEGTLFAYLGGGGSIDTTADGTLNTAQTGDHFGFSVDGAGDVNGDGYGDVIVGAPRYDGGEANEGRAIIYAGSASGLNATPYKIIEVNQAGAFFGYSVAAAGDTNNDGFADVLVGAPTFDDGQADEGCAFLYHGAANMNLVADARFESDQAGAILGNSVAGVGDVNGDGYGDVIVGAPMAGAFALQGRAYIYFGGADPADNIADAMLDGPQSESRFGLSVAGAGDANGDGYADVIVGAPQMDVVSGPTTLTDAGTAFVYFGGVGAFNVQADVTLAPFAAQADAQFGFSVAGAGDVNGDGLDDALVGAPNANANGGTATLLYSTTQVPYLNKQEFTGAAGSQYGWSVAAAGDVNRDGYADILIGRPGAAGAMGSATLNYCRANGFFALCDTSAFFGGAPSGARLGYAVAGAGDINGDGYADIVIGAPYALAVTEQPGFANVFLGNSQTGRDVQLEQTSNGSAPIQPWGSSSMTNAFSVAMQGFSPRGRERVKFELQACPPGVAFFSAANGCRSFIAPTWTDTGTNPAGVLQLGTLSGLPEHTLYHWRARLQFAPFTADLTTSTASASLYGPWFYLQAQSDSGDVRTRPFAADTIFADGFE